MVRTVRSGETNICFELVRKPVKNVNLRIRRDGAVLVSARKGIDVDKIDAFVGSKADWICQVLRRIAASPAEDRTPGEYRDGDEIRLLGRPVTYHIAGGNRDRVEFDGERLTLITKDPTDMHQRGKILSKWQNDLCARTFSEALKTAYIPFERMGVAYPKLRLRNMKSRWGSCAPAKGTVTLSRRLIHRPLVCIEAVAAHELAHFLKSGHSKEFYAVLIAAMPDYYDRWRLLNGRE